MDYVLFARIAEAGSISGGARTLLISPAMASKRLARLEARLGVRLVHRTTRRLALTPAGRTLHADLRGIMAALKAAEDRARGIRDQPSGTLRVSAPTSFGRLHVAPRLGPFLAACPQVALHLDLSDAYVDLMADHVDVAIRITAGVPPGLRAHQLASSRRVLTASPGYIAAYGAPERIEDLARHRLLAADGQLPWRLMRERRLEIVEGPSCVGTNSSEIVRELAVAGVGIALRSLWDVGEELRAGRLVRLLPEWEGRHDLGIYAVHLDTDPTAAAAAFIATLKRLFDPAPWEV